MTRVIVAVVALLVALAGPAQAWCEATCVKPASQHAHCPAHQQSNSPTLTAPDGGCPVIDATRPSTVARVELATVTAVPVANAGVFVRFVRVLRVEPRGLSPTVRHRPLRI